MTCSQGPYVSRGAGELGCRGSDAEAVTFGMKVLSICGGTWVVEDI
jgi:hypothetical protein